MDHIAPSRTAATARFTAEDIAQYRRDGYVVARGIMGPRSITACATALSDLATGRIAARNTVLMYEAGRDAVTLPPDEREFAIRKYMDFCADAPALMMAAMNRRLHTLLDQLLGRQGLGLCRGHACAKQKRDR